MARKCGCAATVCACGIDAGDGIQITGSGSPGTDPYVISVCVSTDPDNSISIGSDGCIYSGGGLPCLSTNPNNTLSVGTDGCLYNKAVSLVDENGNPLDYDPGTNTYSFCPAKVPSADREWPYACNISAAGIYKNAAGELWTHPPVIRSRATGFDRDATGYTYTGNGEQVVLEACATITNPDQCRSMSIDANLYYGGFQADLDAGEFLHMGAQVSIMGVPGSPNFVPVFGWKNENNGSGTKSWDPGATNYPWMGTLGPGQTVEFCAHYIIRADSSSPIFFDYFNWIRIEIEGFTYA